MPDIDETPDRTPELTLEQRQTFLVEYTAAQASAEHHDTLVWTVSSLNWAGSALLMGLVLGKEDGPHRLAVRLALCSLCLVGIALAALVWRWALQMRAVKIVKYERCKALEALLGMSQHSGLRYPVGAQTKAYALLMLLFLGAWLIVMHAVILGPGVN